MQVSHLANAKLDRSTLSFARCEADSMWGKHDSKWTKLASQILTERYCRISKYRSLIILLGINSHDALPSTSLARYCFLSTMNYP
jgi:hypothetical protein